MARRLLALLLITTVAVLVASLTLSAGREAEAPPVAYDWDAIQARDTLVLLTTYNSTSYFLYRGEPMGFEYELARAFAEAHDLVLRTLVVRDRDSLYTLLRQGVGDVVAARLIARPADTARVAFSAPLYATQPVLVQREAPPLPDSLPAPVPRLLARDAGAALDTAAETATTPASAPAGGVVLRARRIVRPAQLAGEQVHVGPSSAYTDRLLELSDEITGDIEVVEVESTATVEALMRSVALGEINLTVSPANVAELSEAYYDNLLVRPALGLPDSVAWALRPNAPALRTALDAWLADYHASGQMEALYRRYFVDRAGYRERVASDYLASETGRLSPYDALFQRHAPALGWDWRLLASQAFQESRFEPTARSWAGAAGLLQLMPGTARQYGVTSPYDPEDNVAGAVRFLDWLLDYWAERIPDETERLEFVLASYNAGHGHVEDARRLTAKHGGNDARWEEVAYWMLQLSKRDYYTDPVVRYGFCRGLEPVSYVSRILDRYEHYRQFVEV